MAVLVAAVTTLVGCTATQGPSASPTPDSDERAVSAISWNGGAENPTLEFATPLRVSEPTIGVVEPGSGASIAMGQLVTFDSMVVDGDTGTTESSTFGTDTPNQLVLASSTANSTMLTAMQSAKVGARFLYVVPTDSAVDSTASGASPSAPANVASKVIAISIRSVSDLPAAATGTQLALDPSLPVVKMGADGTPSLVAPKGKPSAKLRSGVSIEGAGPVISEGQTVAVKYYGWLWDGTVFDSVWGAGAPEVVNLDEVISGWSQAIVGKKVGSRVLMVVPPAQAYGGAGQGAIPPDATLVFLVDVVAAY